MAAERLVVTTVGTCRLSGPLDALIEAGETSILKENTNVYGFVHTLPEILQQLDYLEGRVLPAELGRYLSFNGQLPPPRQRSRPDFWVVEVSSLKEVLLDGVYLQINNIAKQFTDRKELLRVFWSHPGTADLPRRQALLEAEPTFADCDETDRHMLLHAVVNLTSREQFEAGVLAIRDRLPEPVLFVSHINVAQPGGKLLAARIRISEWLAEIAARHGIALFDPTNAVAAAGVAVAMEKQGHDLSHYAPDFMPTISRLLHQHIRQALPVAGG